jgi:uncharacterized membrane protein
MACVIIRFKMDHFDIHILKSRVFTTLSEKHHRTARITVAIVLVFGIAFSLAAPPLWGLDEVAHFNRVLDISNGHIIPKKDVINAPNNIPNNLRALEYTVYMDLSDNKTTELFFNRKDVSYSDSYKILDAQKFSRTLEASPISAAYSPFAYIGPVVGVVIAKVLGLTIGSTILLARLGGLLSYTALVYFAIALLDNYRLKFLVAVIALLPVSIFQASTVSADTLNIGLSLVFVALIFRLLLDKSKKDINKKMLIGISTSAILLSLIKINNIALLPLILLIPRSVFATQVRGIIYKVFSTIVPIAAVFFWTVLVPITTNLNSVSPRLDGLPVNATAQLHLLATHPLHLVTAAIASTLTQFSSYLGTMTTTLGWNVATLPSMLTLFSVALLVIAGVYAKTDLRDNKVMKIVFPIIGLAAAASVFAAMYVAFNPVGFHRVDGIQGRYFIPYISLVLVSFAYLPLELRIKKKYEGTVFLASAFALLTVVFVCYLLVLH